MNFRDLEYIIAVGKHRSFSYAAELCNVSQPSLSAQIKKVESELGAEIFVRSRRSVRVTPYGEQFIERAKAILGLTSEMQELAQQSTTKLEGKVSLGAILTVAPYLFSDVVKLVTKHAPGIQLVLVEGKTERLLSDLLHGKIDAAIISLPTDEHVFETRALFRESFYVAVGANHALAKRDVLSDNDLKGVEFILLDEGHCFRKQALDICQGTSAKENEVFQATSLETIRHYVSAVDGVTLMPQIARKERDGLIYLPLENPRFTRDIGVVWRKASNKKALLERMASIIHDCLDLKEIYHYGAA